MTTPSTAALQAFQEQRPVLFGIAYRMLGSVSEAEDMVQETYLRWQRQDHEQIQSTRAWLTATTTRLCIDQLRSARQRREQYVGVWLPEPLVQSTTDHAAPMTALADSLSTAFLILLETLGPDERAIFLLHEVFEYDYAEISRIVDRSEPACRQTVHRARERISLRKNRFSSDPLQHEQVVREFMQVCREGNMDKLLGLLSENVTLYSDGGGKISAAPRPVHGCPKVARFLTGVYKTSKSRGDIRFAVINGCMGVLRYWEGKLVQTTALEISEGLVQNIYVMRNPDKLQHLAETMSPGPI